MRISDWSSDVCSSDLEQTWAPPSSARRFVINRFLNAADTSAITPSGLRFLAVRLTLASVPLGPGAIRAFVKGARSTHPGGLGSEGTCTVAASQCGVKLCRHGGRAPSGNCGGPRACLLPGCGHRICHWSRSDEHTSDIQSPMSLSYDD